MCGWGGVLLSLSLQRGGGVFVIELPSCCLRARVLQSTIIIDLYISVGICKLAS